MDVNDITKKESAPVDSSGTGFFEMLYYPFVSPMAKYIYKRLLYFPFVVLLISIFSFSIIHLAPGDPAQFSTALDPSMNKTEIKQKILELRKSLD